MGKFEDFLESPLDEGERKKKAEAKRQAEDAQAKWVRERNSIVCQLCGKTFEVSTLVRIAIFVFAVVSLWVLYGVPAIKADSNTVLAKELSRTQDRREAAAQADRRAAKVQAADDARRERARDRKARHYNH